MNARFRHYHVFFALLVAVSSNAPSIERRHEVDHRATTSEASRLNQSKLRIVSRSRDIINHHIAAGPIPADVRQALEK